MPRTILFLADQRLGAGLPLKARLEEVLKPCGVNPMFASLGDTGAQGYRDQLQKDGADVLVTIAPTNAVTGSYGSTITYVVEMVDFASRSTVWKAQAVIPGGASLPLADAMVTSMASNRIIPSNCTPMSAYKILQRN
jgi:hypothetical protein